MYVHVGEGEGEGEDRIVEVGSMGCIIICRVAI